MKETLIHVLREYPNLSVLISLALSILVALAGLLPSFFITAANLFVFGFWKGTLISFLGEALGAVLAFQLYRRGFRDKAAASLSSFPRVQRLVEAEGRSAFLLIFSLRLLPFVPSGLVTFAASIGKVSLPLFVTASSLGKIPALLIEAWSVYQLSQVHWAGRLALIFAALVLLIFTAKQKTR